MRLSRPILHEDCTSSRSALNPNGSGCSADLEVQSARGETMANRRRSGSSLGEGRRRTSNRTTEDSNQHRARHCLPREVSNRVALLFIPAAPRVTHLQRIYPKIEGIKHKALQASIGEQQRTRSELRGAGLWRALCRGGSSRRRDLRSSPHYLSG